MKLNKEQFLKSEFGSELEGVIKAWDIALQQSRNASETLRDLAWCQAQWEVYKLALKHFYGVEYFFTRTDAYFGICTEDESDWLMKVERTISIVKTVTRRGIVIQGREYWNDDLVIRFLGLKVSHERTFERLLNIFQASFFKFLFKSGFCILYEKILRFVRKATCVPSARRIK